MKVILSLINSSLILSSVLAVHSEYFITRFPQLDTLYFELWQKNQFESVHELESDLCYDVFNSKIFHLPDDISIESVTADIRRIDKNLRNMQISYENKRIKLGNGQVLGEQVLPCYFSENIKLYVSHFWENRLFAFYEKPHIDNNILTVLGLVEPIPKPDHNNSSCALESYYIEQRLDENRVKDFESFYYLYEDVAYRLCAAGYELTPVAANRHLYYIRSGQIELQWHHVTAVLTIQDDNWTEQYLLLRSSGDRSSSSDQISVAIPVLHCVVDYVHFFLTPDPGNVRNAFLLKQIGDNKYVLEKHVKDISPLHDQSKLYRQRLRENANIRSTHLRLLPEKSGNRFIHN